MRSNKHVLMIDDDQHDIFLTQRAFKKLGWDGQFDAVTGGQEFLNKFDIRSDDMPGDSKADNAQQTLPRLILLDLNMPAMDGFEVLKRLRSDKRRSQLPVIVLTTSEAQDDIDKAYELGANSFITKPSTPAGLQELAERFCDYWFDLVSLPAATRRSSIN